MTATQDAIEKIEIRYKIQSYKNTGRRNYAAVWKNKTIMQQTVVEADPLQKALLTEKLDNILLHQVFGVMLFYYSCLFLLFQSIFWIAQYPMDAIEWSFGKLGGWLGSNITGSVVERSFNKWSVGGLKWYNDICSADNDIVWIDNIAGRYRLYGTNKFFTDKLMRKVGLNGKSVMPMISGFACAVPAIMSARNIENKKERLLTIMCTPLMSCSARLPVYTILIALIIPNHLYFGFLSLQGFVMMALYLLGTVMALVIGIYNEVVYQE